MIKHNSSRTTRGTRKFLDSEIQLWNHLGLIHKTGASYFVPEKGYGFDWEAITKIINY
ncbi:MAG: hypothetical protein ACI9E5_000256 [Candidatus Omnitrophota bacterium]